MNTQDIVNPIADLMTASFEYLLVPTSQMVNFGSVALGVVGLIYWLNLQKKLSRKARNEGGIL